MARRGAGSRSARRRRSEEHTSELQSLRHLVCRLLLEKKKSPGTDPLSCLAAPAGFTYITGAGGGCVHVSPLIMNANLSDGQVTLMFAERDFVNSVPLCGGNCIQAYIRTVTFDANVFIANTSSLPALQSLVGPTQNNSL